jgi:hypothetical protein
MLKYFFYILLGFSLVITPSILAQEDVDNEESNVYEGDGYSDEEAEAEYDEDGT